MRLARHTNCLVATELSERNSSAWGGETRTPAGDQGSDCGGMPGHSTHPCHACICTAVAAMLHTWWGQHMIQLTTFASGMELA